jgi:hypothetical protein
MIGTFEQRLAIFFVSEICRQQGDENAAAALGCSRQSVSSWKLAKKFPNAEKVQSIIATAHEELTEKERQKLTTLVMVHHRDWREIHAIRYPRERRSRSIRRAVTTVSGASGGNQDDSQVAV